ncbi:MAG: hypothetical protein QNK05_22970 [Myxococcota bacterium]|nr:hypothetical protein [Myxococcota bacterium]
MTPRFALAAALTALTSLALLAAPDRAHAGCGCDHPPPEWSVVMPPFASPGKTVTLFAEAGEEFVVGDVYTVRFDNRNAVATATMTDRLEVTMPSGVKPGPVAIEVEGTDFQVVYPDTAFTALTRPRKIKSYPGVFSARTFKASVSADGTLLLPLRVHKVLDAMQFSFAMRDLPLAYGHDDVVIYNADGVDLTLFTLDVDSVEKQWGEYYGWSVEGDAGIVGDVYYGLASESDDLAHTSDVFSYWRHEFHTYKDAHGAGGSHEVQANGYHPDGTLHVDHDNLIIAIRGVVRDPSAPEDPDAATDLEPGVLPVDLGWVSLRSDTPLDTSLLMMMMASTDEDWAEALEEWLEGDDD